ncbi:hypothetical protein [Celeribacter ethanolicus]|uniref:Uncharacterized protein n=1 Tax=Celeribacter ethanolicus TaxID=1758178 RepID=A0A291GDA6_9RHOB|nr:hypothetical protein [Celeribacter ethanolicus]ATG48024.1 hypothetical protein CEW89_10900 [Celeribacter ethanolicus]TNE68521.1 MAG: hypothetical protein EP336_04765 [Paracoccaceae bacterium]
MVPERWPQLALTLLVAGVLLAGILAVGGPEAGRSERRDDQRYWDLIAYQSQLICLARAKGGSSLPTTLEDTTTCSINLSEHAILPEEGYRYLPQAGGDYRFCARFEDVDRLRDRQGRKDISRDGCISGKID